MRAVRAQVQMHAYVRTLHADSRHAGRKLGCRGSAHELGWMICTRPLGGFDRGWGSKPAVADYERTGRWSRHEGREGCLRAVCPLMLSSLHPFSLDPLEAQMAEISRRCANVTAEGQITDHLTCCASCAYIEGDVEINRGSLLPYVPGGSFVELATSRDQREDQTCKSRVVSRNSIWCVAHVH